MEGVKGTSFLGVGWGGKGEERG